MSRTPNAELSSSLGHSSIEEQETLRRELDAVMASVPFRGSQQCRGFLSYVVTHSLRGDEGSLKERVIGNAVFGRSTGYDTGDDPVVRIRAAEVRKRLAQYYQSLEQPPRVTIQIPSGSYRASFIWERDSVAPQPAATVTEEPPQVVSPSAEAVVTPSLPALEVKRDHASTWATKRSYTPWMIAASAVVLALIATAIVVRYRRSLPDRLVTSFWAPFLNSPKPVLIAIGSNAVYRISDDFADQYSREHHLQDEGMEFYPTLPPDATLRSVGMHSAADSFVALGDVAAVSEAVTELTRLQKPYQERFSNDISFAELRSAPTLLIGGFNNPMTRELTRNFPIVFVSRHRIEDRQQPGKAWVLTAPEDSHDTEDYAIISRSVQDGNAPLICVAGMGQYGTLAATDFVFQPAAIASLEKLSPTDWQHHNLQLLLRIKVIDFKPVSVDVIASHIW